MRSYIVTVSIPVLLISIAISTGWLVVPWLIRQEILARVGLSPEVNPDLYSAWVHPPMPIFFKIYLFNVTNAEEVLGGALPNLEEVGPYVFRENRTKINIHMDEASDTISYSEYMSFHFDENLSSGLSLQDEHIIINVPYVAAAMKISHDLPWPMNDIGRTILVQKEYAESVFIRRSTAEILFSGWSVPFLEKIDQDLGLTLIPNNTFSYFMGENDTIKGPYTVSRGIKVKQSVGAVLKYQNKTQLDVWEKGSNCNRIQGTDGTLFAPFMSKNATLRFFNPKMCQSVYATFENEVSVKGIKAFRFTVPKRLIEDPRKSEENKCYCVHIDDEPDKCLKRGAYDMGPCREGNPPVAMSPPYFLNADPEYITKSGLQPEAEKHAAYLDVEPLTGVVLRGSSKLQVNLILKPVQGVRSLSKVPDMLFPLFWADECAEADSESMGKLKTNLFLVWLVEFASKISLLVIAISLSVWLVYKRLGWNSSLMDIKQASLPNHYEIKGSHKDKTLHRQQVPLTSEHL